MVFNRKFRNRSSAPVGTTGCSCGETARLKSRKNYPFGSKSSCVLVRFYKCSSCKKETIANKVREVKR